VASHWTYEDVAQSDEDLKQGDILFPTDELREVLGQVHPHFCDPKYLGFMVVTQCCDLVRRGETNRCSTDHISLSVIRDFDTLIETFLDGVCDRVSAGVYLHQSKALAHNLIIRILNQNEQALGLFYLHHDLDTTGISENAVALLRVTVSLRAGEHYETLVKARRCSLRPAFRNKVGWIAGNLYSRVGTPDWSEQENGNSQLKKLVGTLLDCEQYKWVQESEVLAATQNEVNFENLTREEILHALKENKPEPLKNRIANEANKVAEKLLSDLPAAIAGSVSVGFATQFAQAGITLSPDDIKQHLSSVLGAIPDGIAATVAQNIVEGKDLNGIDPQHFVSSFQGPLKDAIEKHVQDLPHKLRSRLLNNPILARAIDREEAL
jgi:hypothetical protein